MLFMFLYKGLWLCFVAYPMWKNGTLEGSEAADWPQIFMLIIVPMIFMPWEYVYKTNILGRN